MELPRFSRDPASAVAAARAELDGSPFKKRMDELCADPLYRSHKICTTSWPDRTIAICCETCQVSGPCYLCIPCFLRGSHQGHKVFVSYVSTTTCCCGNPNKMKSSGFCPNHCQSSANPHLEDFGEELSEVPIRIFAEAFQSFTFLAAFDPDGLKIVVDFLESVATKSDALMRCLAIAMCQRNNFSQFLIDAAVFNQKALSMIINFFYNFFADDLFVKLFSLAFIQSVTPFSNILINHELKMISNTIFPPHRHVIDFLILNVSFFRTESTKYFFENGFNITPGILNSIVKFFSAINSNFNYSYAKLIFYSKFLLFYAEIFSGYPENEIQPVIDTIMDFVENYECSHFFHRETNEKKDDSAKVQELCNDITDSLLSVLMSLYPFIKNYNELFIKWYLNNELVFKDLQNENHSLNALPFEYMTTLDPASDISSMLLFATFFGTAFSKDTDPTSKLKNFLNLIKLNELTNISSNENITVENFLKTTIVMPLRWLVTVHQSSFGLFIRNDNSLLKVAQKFIYKGSITKRFMPIFLLIQIYAGLYPDKNEFMKMIVSIYGLFYSINDEQLESSNIFSMIYFISCLIVDRSIIKQNMEEFKKLIIIGALQEKPLTIIALNKKLWYPIITPSFLEDLEKVAIRVPGEEYSSFKLRPDVKWSFLQPWVQQSEILKQMGNYMKKHEKQLVPFPEWEDEPFDLNLRDYLITKYLYALEYKILSDFISGTSSNSSSVHIVLNLIMLTHKLFGSEAPQDSIMHIKADSMVELVNILPEKFGHFLRTPISYNGRPLSTVIEMLKSIGVIANTVLALLGIETPKEENISETIDNSKSKAMKLKASIMEKFKNQQSAFTNTEIDFTDNEECAVCQMPKNNSVLCYPALLHLTGITSYLKDGKFKPAAFINICTHLVHESCAMHELSEGFYRCPIDRSLYNLFLPIVQCGYKIDKLTNVDEELQNEIALIKVNFASFVEAFHPATIIAGHLVIAETRNRLWPNRLDKPAFVIFMSCFFINAWHLLRVCQTEASDNGGKTCRFFEHNNKIIKIMPVNNTPIENLVYTFMTSNNPDENIKETVKNFAGNLKDKDLLLYLRQAVLFQHFCLNMHVESEDDFIDWEEVLSFESLCIRFEIEPTFDMNIEIPVFSLIPLPDNFLELAMPPYSLNLAETKQLIALCLLTNTVVSISRTYEGCPYKSLNEHLHQLGGTTLLLLLNGPFSTAIAVTSNQFSFVVKIVSPYVDEYGDEDGGFVAGHMLTLSHYRLKLALDLYLSGEWTQFIPKQNQ